MRDVEFFIWEYPRPGKRTWGRTTYRLTAEDAAVRYPGARPVAVTREVRRLPETDQQTEDMHRRAVRGPAPGSQADRDQRKG
jgi:hypothetical protein